MQQIYMKKTATFIYPSVSTETDFTPRTRPGQALSGEDDSDDGIEDRGENVQGFSPNDMIATIPKFPDVWNNSLMNSVLQSVVHAQNLSDSGLNEFFRASSATPALRMIISTAINVPGKRFSSFEIVRALREIRANIPSTCLERRDMADLLKHIMLWMNRCQVLSTLLDVTVFTTCQNCQSRKSTATELGPVGILPPPSDVDNVQNLIIKLQNNVHCGERCETCKLKLNKMFSFNSPEVIVLVLPRSADETILRQSVTPNKKVYIPGISGKQKYNLSSVICHKPSQSHPYQFYTYLFYPGMFFKADNLTISVGNRVEDARDISRNGIIYVYKKNTDAMRDEPVEQERHTNGHEEVLAEQAHSSEQDSPSYLNNNTADVTGNTEEQEININRQEETVTDEELWQDAGHDITSERPADPSDSTSMPRTPPGQAISGEDESDDEMEDKEEIVKDFLKALICFLFAFCLFFSLCYCYDHYFKWDYVQFKTNMFPSCQGAAEVRTQ
ncbi:uncharacterized protein LOC121628560 [Melanotaenia boesemani]|uniref:uncharacterized protein LOC121628560 n=1 Tax=Melanotaenia boesemani TaxID=1250792 RepID=UPI001C04E590|nr:uncharacterized protein LOC121628560 [Melanotaenia boesemani]